MWMHAAVDRPSNPEAAPSIEQAAFPSHSGRMATAPLLSDLHNLYNLLPYLVAGLSATDQLVLLWNATHVGWEGKSMNQGGDQLNYVDLHLWWARSFCAKACTTLRKESILPTTEVSIRLVGQRFLKTTRGKWFCEPQQVCCWVTKRRAGLRAAAPLSR